MRPSTDMKSRQTSERLSPVATSDLQAELESLLQNHFKRAGRIVTIDRRPSAYASSFPVERLTVLMSDGSVLEILFKNLSRRALMADAIRAKPSILFNPLREIETYRRILGQSFLGTATFYGAVVDPRRDIYWIFLEWIDGKELYQFGDPDYWKAAARWLIRLHTSSGKLLESVQERVPLIRYDSDFYRQWLTRAKAFSRRGNSLSASGFQRRIDWIEDRYDLVIERLLSLPTTLIHGEYYPSNLLIQTNEARVRVCPVDWETAGIGPGLVDLAALTSGSWEGKESIPTDLVSIYRQGTKESSLSALEGPDFTTALNCCRLHVAVQWLGWSERWQPPPQHKYAWLQEAVRLVEMMEL